MKPLHRRKFMRAIKECCSTRSMYSDVDQYSTCSSTHTTFQMEFEQFSSELELSTHTEPCVRQQHSITIRYIHCKNVFLLNIKDRSVLNLNPFDTSLKDLYSLIASQLDIPKELTLELFFSEGYPLDVNDHTISGMYNFCVYYHQEYINKSVQW